MTKLLYPFCVLMIAAEWIGFGSLHFLRLDATEAQIPDFIPLKTFIAIVTGMVEVATGCVILLPAPWIRRSRKWEALTTMVLLVLFLPAIYEMLRNDEAMVGFRDHMHFVRVILIPNHIALACCAFYLWRQSQDNSTSCRQPLLERVTSHVRALSNDSASTLVALVMLAANTAGLLVVCMAPWRVSTAVLWGIMCLAVGAIVGFLFGVPKIDPNKATEMKYRPNSNVEVISDWLTKIIVGVGLVEFNRIGDYLQDISAELGKALVLQPMEGAEIEAASFAKALIVYFLADGMIQGYLLTRMYLGRQFEKSEGGSQGG